jgi:hypothetical protein
MNTTVPGLFYTMLTYKKQDLLLNWQGSDPKLLELLTVGDRDSR